MDDTLAVGLQLDTSLVRFQNTGSRVAFVWRQFADCFRCPLLFWSEIGPNSTQTLTNSTNSDLVLAVSLDRKHSLFLWDPDSAFCRQTYAFRDQSVHQITIQSTEHGFECTQRTLADGRNNAWPLVVAAVLYVAFAAAVFGGRLAWRRWRHRPTEQPVTSDSSDDTRRKRLQSLDCFRGITILMMIFVNVGAGDYAQLEHAHWDGLHFADVIFPWFVFIMGTTMAISLKSQVVRRRAPKSAVFFAIAKRALTLFTIGLMLNSNGDPNWLRLRIPGVLQRFGITYFVVASAHALSLYLHSGQLFGALRVHQLVDVIPFWPEWILTLSVTSLHLALTFFWNFDPNCPVGYVGPGGLYDNASHPHCTGGAAYFVDRWLLSDAHLYQGFTGRQLYDPNGAFHSRHDPEGVLGTCNSVLLAFLGLQAGKILTAFPDPKPRLWRWLAWGVATGALAALTAAPGWIPVNKNLWSLSFVCLTASAAFFLLALLYYTIDVTHWWTNGTPFHFPGQNAILLYIGHEMCAQMLPFAFNVPMTSHVGPLARDLCCTTLWLCVSVRLAQNNFFLTV